jgi:transcriptional regulator with XRE-family HTH domain
VEVSVLIRQRLTELGLEQRELAVAADVTESYISQLLTRKKLPPSSDRTDIYEKLSRLLKLPAGELARLADIQRKQELIKKIEDPLTPLFKEVRELILHKCKPAIRNQVRAIFERQPFGEFERLITQKLVDAVKSTAKDELGREDWLRSVAKESHRSYKQMRVAILEFLDTDVLHISAENSLSFLDQMIASWNIDLSTFALDIVLNPRMNTVSRKRFEFVETSETEAFAEEAGFREFCNDSTLSKGATEEEVQFLKQIRFNDQRRPSALYYYRELQNLRDPLHFRNK